MRWNVIGIPVANGRLHVEMSRCGESAVRWNVIGIPVANGRLHVYAEWRVYLTRYPGLTTMVPGEAERVSYVFDAPPAVATMARRVSCLPDKYPGVATMVPGVPELVSHVFETHAAVATMATGVSCLPDMHPGVATTVPGLAELVLYLPQEPMGLSSEPPSVYPSTRSPGRR